MQERMPPFRRREAPAPGRYTTTRRCGAGTVVAPQLVQVRPGLPDVGQVGR